MLTEGLEPIPEKSYTRILYLGKLKLMRLDGGEHNNQVESSNGITLEEMMNEIWSKSSVYNKANFISGHLACSKSLHVVQLLEGEDTVVDTLMKKIRKDPRVVIQKELRKKLLTMSVGWELSMCYSFEITSSERNLIKNEDISIEKMFDMMKNTYQVRQEKLDIPAFYKHIIECILLKYISTTLGETVFDELTPNPAPIKPKPCNIL